MQVFAITLYLFVLHLLDIRILNCDFPQLANCIVVQPLICRERPEAFIAVGETSENPRAGSGIRTHTTLCHGFLRPERLPLRHSRKLNLHIFIICYDKEELWVRFELTLESPLRLTRAVQSTSMRPKSRIAGEGFEPSYSGL